MNRPGGRSQNDKSLGMVVVERAYRLENLLSAAHASTACTKTEPHPRSVLPFVPVAIATVFERQPGAVFPPSASTTRPAKPVPIPKAHPPVSGYAQMVLMGAGKAHQPSPAPTSNP